MTVWQEMVFSLCLCLVITGVVRLLFPSGNWQRIGQTATAFLLVAVVLQVVGSFFGQTFHGIVPANRFEPVAVVTEEGMDVLEQAMVEQANGMVLQLAQQYGVVANNICIQTRRDTNQVFIEKISLSVKGENQSVLLFQKALSHGVAEEVEVEREDTK